jgi:hypothetical protein
MVKGVALNFHDMTSTRLKIQQNNIFMDWNFMLCKQCGMRYHPIEVRKAIHVSKDTTRN